MVITSAICAGGALGCADTAGPPGSRLSRLPGKSSPARRTSARSREDRTGFAERICDVVCFFPIDTWKSFDRAGDRNPEGFAFVLYLLDCATGRGAYAGGLVHVHMYRINHDADGKKSRELVQDWTLDHDQLNARKPTRLGYGYQPFLSWGKNVDVLGEEVEIVVQYESPTGDVVQAQTVHRKVPPRKA